MSYTPPVIDSAGLHVPLYADILQYLISNFQNIYGQDIYLENDAADYEWISILSYAYNDVMLGLQYEYNNRSPLNALGVALDSLVQVNGITRKVSSNSICDVTLTGTPFAIIKNGLVQDSSGNYWSLPQITIIGSGGTITVTATCQTGGAITALPNTLTIIATPQYGWSGVTNANAASVGQPVEDDEELRARQSLSTQLASHTMLSGTEAGIAAVEGVTRYSVHENNTSEVDEDYCPPHSITAIVEGGADDDVADAIFLNRGIGCDTYGGNSGSGYNVEVEVTDPDTGNTMIINFMRPEYIPIYVTVNITPLAGYVSSIQSAIVAAVNTYLNSLQIGQGLTLSALYSVVMSQMANIKSPTFSVTSILIGVTPETLNTQDIGINFNEVTQGILGTSPAYIIVND